MEFWEPKVPGTLWPTPGLLRDCFTFTSKAMSVTSTLVYNRTASYSYRCVSDLPCFVGFGVHLFHEHLIVRNPIKHKTCL